MISCHLPKRISTCSRIGTKPSSQSAIGGTSMRSSSSRQRRDHLVRRLERRLELAEEHRAVELEVVVVAAVERVEVDRPLAREVLAVGDDRALVPVDDVAVVAAQHVDVRRHVQQVAGVGHEVAQLRRRPAAPAPGCGDISMGWMYMCSRPGMRRGRRAARIAALEHLDGLGVSAPSAGLPVSRSHSCHGVRFISASANSAATSRSSGNRA